MSCDNAGGVLGWKVLRRFFPHACNMKREYIEMCVLLRVFRWGGGARGEPAAGV